MRQIQTLSLNVPLKTLVLGQKGKKPAKLSKVKFSESIPYLDIEALERNNITQFADISTSVKSDDNDIFVVWDGSRSGLVSKGKIGAVGSTLMCLTPLGINSSYLYYFLKSKYDYLNRNTTGASIPHINPDIFYNLVVPVVPIEIQKKIVKQLEEKLEIYEDDFESITAELERSHQYRQSILEQAITGQLTANWRQKEVLNSSAIKIYNLSIPSSWQILNMSDVTHSISDGDHQSPKKVSSGIPFILISNIQHGVIDFNNTLNVSESYYESLKDFRKPRKDDILFTVVGSIGQVVLIDKEPNFCFQRHIALIRSSEICLPEFLYFQLLSNFVQEQAIERSKGVAQMTLNLSELRTLKILLPTINEQQEILRVLKPLLHNVGEIIDDHAASLALKEKLKDSILESAFDLKSDLPAAEGRADWEKSFFAQVELEKANKQLDLINSRKHDKAKREVMKETESVNTSLIGIIKDSGKTSLPIEEVWQQSQYYKTGNIEAFYEEIESKTNEKKNIKEVIGWQFSDDNKDQVILKLINHAD